MTVKFTDVEQEEIINEFLDIINLKDYKVEATNEIKCCSRCKDCKEHKSYCVIDEFQLPNEISSQIYSYTYQCYKCQDKKIKIERIDELETVTNPYRREAKRLNLLSSVHRDKLENVKSNIWTPIKKAIQKFQEQVYEDDEDNPKSCRQRLLNGYSNLLHIQKHGNRYMCSSERLDKIDFSITEAPRKHDSAWVNDG